MPSNNTENILSTPFTEGTPNPIPATRISFDGTGTSIEATTVQAAIAELDTDLQSTKDDVDTLKTELRDKYLFTSRGTVSAIGDGTKTIGDMLSELATKFAQLLTTLADDEYIRVESLAGNYAGVSMYPHAMFNKDSTSPEFIFLGAGFTDSWGTMVLHLIKAKASSADCKWLRSILGASTQTFSTDLTSDIFTNERVLEIRYVVYTKV